MKKLHYLFLAVILGLAVQLAFNDVTSAVEVVPVDIEDENLKEYLQDIFGEEVTELELKELDKLEILNDLEITSLAGLEHAENLTTIVISNSEITDLTPISGLVNLTYVSLDGSNISDLTPLHNLLKLETLSLNYNNITSITGMEGLTGLKSLSLTGNKIKELSPLSGLTQLDSLFIRENEISELISLMELSNLTWLDVSDNQITDLSPLAKLSKLEHLFAANNNISEVHTLLEMPGLGNVVLLGNPLNLTKGSASYQNIQHVLKNNVNVILSALDVFNVKTKKVTQDSITIEWSVFENTKQIGDQLTLYLDGEQVTLVEDPNVTEYTFSGLEKGKEYEIKVEFAYNTGFSGGLESLTLNVKAENIQTSEQVVVKPTVLGNNVTISYENINSVQEKGTLSLDLQDYLDAEVNVLLTSEQVEMLKENNIDIEVIKEDATIKIPSGNLTDGTDISVSIDRLAKAEGALSSTYNFEILTESGSISEFSVPVTLIFKVNEALVEDRDLVKVWYYNPTTKEWEYIGGTYSNGEVIALTSHFSTYTVFEKETSSDDESKDEVGAGKDSETVDSDKESEENMLPNTATNTSNLLLLGALIMLAAFVLLQWQRRKEHA